mgnify:CR=1 FL=1
MRPMIWAAGVVLGVGVLAGWQPLWADQAGNPKVFTDPAQAGPDFADQGEYVGEVQTDTGPVKYGAQVIALGDGKFHAVGYVGGLPGDGWDGSEKIHADGQRQGKHVVLSLPEGRKAELSKGVLVVRDVDGREMGRFQKVHRQSPTLGAKPPAGAVVLFDGTSADNFQGGRMSPMVC